MFVRFGPANTLFPPRAGFGAGRGRTVMRSGRWGAR